MLRRVFHGSLGSVNWKSLGIGSPGFENAVLSRLMHSMTTSFSITAIASNGSLAERSACALAAFLDNALAAFCLKTSGSSSGVGGGGGLGTEEFVFGRGIAFGAAWDADAAQLLLLPTGSTVRPRSVTALADGCSDCRCALLMV